MAESARASNVYTLAAEARPPCSGPSTGAPVAARTPKRACGGALVPTQHRPLTAQSLQPPMRE
jgi:hypothetical protein